jgi:hypothetical protein
MVYGKSYYGEAAYLPSAYFGSIMKQQILAREIDCGARTVLIILSFHSDSNKESKITLNYYKEGRSPKVDSHFNALWSLA